MIAPTYIHAGSTRAAILSRLAFITGFRAYHRWDQPGYHRFLEENGFAVEESDVLELMFPLAYVVAKSIR